MANEWVLVKELYNVELHQMTVNLADAIPKGTMICWGEDPNEGTIHTGVTLIPIGITMEEKVAGTGTSIGVRPFNGAIWDVVADGTITGGFPVAAGSVANQVREVRVGNLSTEELRRLLNGGNSRCLETASASERVNILFP